MQTENNLSAKPFFEKIWVKYGLIGGGIAILITVIYYVLDDTLLADRILGLIPLLVILVTAIMAAAELRKRQDGYLAYSQAVTTSLGSFSLSILLSTLFNTLLYLVIEPGLQKKIINLQLQKVYKEVEKGNLPKENYDEIAKRLTESGPQMFLFSLLMGVIGFIIIALIIFLISSAILRKEPKTQI
jgi:hypothetical protein